MAKDEESGIVTRLYLRRSESNLYDIKNIINQNRPNATSWDIVPTYVARSSGTSAVSLWKPIIEIQK